DGFMTHSDNRTGIQADAPTPSNMWTVKVPNPNATDDAHTKWREVPIKLVAASDAGRQLHWTLRLSKADLAIILLDEVRYGVHKQTVMFDDVTVNQFFEEFVVFAERRMRNYRHGLLALPIESD